MIYYLATRAGRHTMDSYLASWGRSLFWDVEVLTYGSVLRKRRHPPGTYIFSDVERMTDSQRDRAAELWERLDERGDSYQLLNHPRRSLDRYDLSRALSEAGINQYKSYRIFEQSQPDNFPVFLRRENDHWGSRTKLIEDQGALDRAIDGLRRKGVNLRPWLAVEFCDTRREDGLYCKYATFNVGGTIVPRSMVFSQGWMIKFPDLIDDAQQAEELEHLRSDEDIDALQRIFEIANIQYGRIDYGKRDGRIQVWEINTNPMMFRVRHTRVMTRRTAQEMFRFRYEAAVRQLLARHRASIADRLAHPVDRLLMGAHVGWEHIRSLELYQDVRRSKQRVIGHRLKM